jgi:HPt (histidine-containing phosphotransfer) domain-containing protein
MLDRQVIEELRDALGDDGVVSALLESYRDSSRDLFLQMQAAVHKKDFKALQDAAHSIKGASSNVGANAVSEHAAALESLAVDPSRGDVHERMKALSLDLRKTEDAIEAELLRLRG